MNPTLKKEIAKMIMEFIEQNDGSLLWHYEKLAEDIWVEIKAEYEPEPDIYDERICSLNSKVNK